MTFARFQPFLTPVLALAIVGCSAETEANAPGGSGAKMTDSACAAVEGVGVVDAWVRETANAAGMSAGYLTICNNSNAAIELTAAETPLAGVVELHETTRTADGVVSMARLPSIRVAPGSSYALTPGGAHLMLMRLAGPIAADDETTITLRFADGATIEAPATARSGASGGHSGHH